MNTSTKTCQPKNVKKAKYKMASPISNDRAEAFVGPQAEVCPRFSEVPTERDKRAFELAAKGMKQREIAKKLHTSQPTVQRAIKKYRLWFGSTLPEDRGELVGWQRFRVAVEERRIFLRHQMEAAMEEWEQSRQSVPMKRTRTKLDPAGRQVDGMPVKDIQIDEWVQHRRATASHLNTAAKRSLELTMLEGGYLGVHKLSCDLAIDTDERDRWDRAVKSYQGTIEELKRKVAELEAKLAAKNEGTGDRGQGTGDQVGRGSPDPAHGLSAGLPACGERGDLRSDVSTGSETRAEPRGEPRVLDESRIASPNPQVNQTSPDSEAASSVQKALSDERSDSPPADLKSVNQMNQEPRSGVPRSQAEPGNENPPPEPKYRWEDSFRQEALDYHCLKFGLPPATTDMATGIPDPFKMSPRLWIERGYPYMIHIDRTIPCDRRNPLDTMGVIKLACHPVVNPEGW